MAAVYHGDVTSWRDVEAAAPELAARIRELFDAAPHKTIATLRADGSPRISGIECTFADGELTFGSGLGTRKSADLHRDPRFALHSPTFAPAGEGGRVWPGEAKIAGRAVAAGPFVSSEADGAPDGERFVTDVREVTLTHLDPAGTRLVVEWWTPETGLHRAERW